MDTHPINQTPAGTLLNGLDVFVKHRKFISRFVVIATVATAITVLLMPKWYKSTASVFPAERTDLLGGLEGVSSLVKSFSGGGRALSSLTGGNEADRYMAILKSGTVLSAVVEKFDLVHVYDITSYPNEKTLQALLDNTDFSVQSEGNLTVTVYDKDPRRAADMANYFVEMLNKSNTELQVQSARGNRQFIEERYNKNLVDLRVGEDSLEAFQQRYGIIALPQQTEASIKAAAEIAGRLASMEVQAAILQRTEASDNPSVVAAQIEIQELRKKMSDLNTGRGAGSDEMKVFVPFKLVPELGAEYIRRFRDVEIQYKILQYILPVYEQAKVEEHRQTPSVVVLDRAGPAERKSKPKVTMYTLLAFVVSTLLAFGGALAAEMYRNLKDAHPERVRNWEEAIRRDWLGLRLRRRP
jgi:uncharacterized protein involved in exopolysaccharide biosynthesis